MLRTMADVLVALAALVAILDYFGIKVRRLFRGPAMPLSRNWKLGVMLALVAASLVMAGYSFYSSMRPKIAAKASIEAYPFVYKENAPMEIVSNRSFVNETVLLDGHEYIDDVFTNVTFRYNGTTPVKFEHNTIRGSMWISTDNGAVGAMAALLKGLGLLPANLPITSGPMHTPLPKVKPPKIGR